MVNVVVEHVVKQVSAEKARPEYEPRPLRQHCPEQGKEAARERNAGRWRHNQPQGIIRVIVMDTVDHEMETMRPLTVTVKVKDNSVQPVLG